MSWLQRLLGVSVYVPNIDAHERHDAEAMRLAHPPFPQWSGEADGFARCTWDGCNAVRETVTPSPLISAGNVESNACVIVDLRARDDDTREILLAGPFFDEDSMRAALSQYLDTGLTPCALVVTPGDYELFRWGRASSRLLMPSREEARERLIELTRQLEYPGMGCAA